MKHLLEFCELDVHREAVEAVIKHGSRKKAAEALKKNRRTIDKMIARLEKIAARAGVSREHDLTHQVAPGFTAKRISTAYKTDGTVALQWVIQEQEKRALDQILEEFREGLKDEIKGLHKPVNPPESTDDKLMSCYIIGDHHFGMYAWSDETGSDDYDTEIAESLLSNAVDRLVSISPNARNGALINVGDLFHANDTTSMTPASKNLL